jgi:hypothetical protein
VEDHAAVATRPEERKISFTWISRFLYRSISKLAGIFPIGTLQICTLRLLARRILAREDMFPQGVAENSAEE